jgi:hypothetical protein
VGVVLWLAASAQGDGPRAQSGLAWALLPAPSVEAAQPLPDVIYAVPEGETDAVALAIEAERIAAAMGAPAAWGITTPEGATLAAALGQRATIVPLSLNP